MTAEIVTAIVGGIVAIASLIFRAKTKRKITKRKTKEVTTKDKVTDPETLENTIN